MTATLSDRKLSLMERLLKLEDEALIGQLEDLLPPAHESADPDVDTDLTPEEDSFLDRRIAEMEANPDELYTWEQVLQEIRARA